MTAIRRYSKEEFSEILKVWYGYELPTPNGDGSHSYRFDTEPKIELEVTATLTLGLMEYGSLESHYRKVLSERGSDYFEYLTSKKMPGGSFKLISSSKLKDSFLTSVRAEYHIIHILEISIDSVPLYLNCPIPEVAKIAALRLMFGK